MRGPRCDCGRALRSQDSKDAGKCQECRGKDGPNVPLTVLYPGDVLMNEEKNAGFVWSIDGDKIEVRNYHSGGCTIRHMSRAEACSHRIIPNDTYGADRPLLSEARP